MAAPLDMGLTYSASQTMTMTNDHGIHWAIRINLKVHDVRAVSHSYNVHQPKILHPKLLGTLYSLHIMNMLGGRYVEITEKVTALAPFDIL